MSDELRLRTVWRLKDGSPPEMKVDSLRDGRVLFHPMLPGIVRQRSLDRERFLETYRQVGGTPEED